MAVDGGTVGMRLNGHGSLDKICRILNSWRESSFLLVGIFYLTRRIIFEDDTIHGMPQTSLSSYLCRSAQVIEVAAMILCGPRTVL